jgi:hypothetical protein
MNEDLRRTEAGRSCKIIQNPTGNSATGLTRETPGRRCAHPARFKGEEKKRGNSFLIIKKFAFFFWPLKKVNFPFNHQFYFTFFFAHFR